MHGSILPTESTKTGCFCAHTRVHTERTGKPSMLLRSAKACRLRLTNGCYVYYSFHGNALKHKQYTKNTNTESTYDELTWCRLFGLS